MSVFALVASVVVGQSLQQAPVQPAPSAPPLTTVEGPPPMPPADPKAPGLSPDALSTPPIPAPAPVAAPVAPAPAAEVKAEAAPAFVVERPTVEADVGLRGFFRTFGTTDNSGLVARWSGGSPGVAASLAYFPGASFTKSLAGDLGLWAEGQFSLGLNATFGTETFASSLALVRGGVALRIPTSRHQVLLSAGVQSSSFTVASTSVNGTAKPTLPDVGFFGPRASIGWAVALGDTVSFNLKVGASYNVSNGALSTAFPSSSSAGVDGSAALGWMFVPNLVVRVYGDVSHTFIGLTEAHNAGETVLGGGLGVAVRM